MRRKFSILLIGIVMILCSNTFSQTIIDERTKPYLDTNCNQAKYFVLGSLCQNINTGKLYKGIGTNIEEIAAGSGDLSGYALLAGRAGGQTLYGGTATGNDLQLYSNPSKDGKIKLGDNAYWDEALGLLMFNVSGGYRLWGYNGNVALGDYNLSVVSGGSNTAIGSEALEKLTSGTENVAVGVYSMYGSLIGNYNIAVGNHSLKWSKGGEQNVAIGYQSLTASVLETNNVAIGYQSLTNLTSATGTITKFEDNLAGGTTVTSVGHGLVGTSVYIDETTSYNGQLIISNVTTDTFDISVAFVADDGYGTWYKYGMSGENTVIGTVAGQNSISGARNTLIGFSSGRTSTVGSNNVFLGYYSGYYETGSNKLFIDSLNRETESDARTEALIYGVFDNYVANQELHLNAKISGYQYFQDNLEVRDVSVLGSESLAEITFPNPITLWTPAGDFAWASGTITAVDISFDSATKTIATAAGDFLAAGIYPGGSIGATVTWSDTGAITAFADSSVDPGNKTKVTSGSHTLINGDKLDISDTTSYNGTWYASNVTTNTYDIGMTFVANDATGTWVKDAQNAGPYTVVSVTASSIVVSETLVDELAGASVVILNAATANPLMYANYSTGAGTLTQADSDMAIAGVGGSWYKLVYVVKASTTDGTLTLTSALALTTLTLDKTVGTHTVNFQAAVAPTDFVIDIAGASTGGIWLDDLSLKEVQGGDVIANGVVNARRGLNIQTLKPASGTYYLCIDSTGAVTSSASACGGM
jgi:hypothetical protein